jgi:hypothetical protein
MATMPPDLIPLGIADIRLTRLCFGTGTLFVDKREKGGLRYRCYPLAELYMQENHQGIVDTIHRRFRLTARQAVQKFGADKLPEMIVKKAADKPEDESEFIHCVHPSDDVAYGRADYRGMPWASSYVSIEGKAVVQEGGYTSWPYPTGRYVQAPGETYGRSPAMMVLPNIKVLNEQKRTMLKMGHRLVDPILLAHDDGVIDVDDLHVVCPRGSDGGFGEHLHDLSVLKSPRHVGADVAVDHHMPRSDQLLHPRPTRPVDATLAGLAGAGQMHA